MNAVAPTPRSIGELLDAGIGLYRRSFGAVLPFAALSSMLTVLPNLLQPDDAAARLRAMSWMFPLSLALGGLALTLRIALLRKLDDVAAGSNRLALREAYVGGLRFFWPMFGASVLYGLAVAGGLLLLVVPGCIFGVSMYFFRFALLLDGAEIGESITRSRRLVRGQWWRVASILTVAAMIYLALGIGILALLGLLLPFGGLLSLLTAQTGPATLAALIAILAMAGLNVVLLPLIYSISLVTYRDLQVRKGGADLAARIADAA